MPDKIERVDFGKDHPYFDATLKPMPTTGEIVARMRMRIPGMHTKRVSVTMAKMWDDPTNPPWQNPHLHRGLAEGYVVTKGWMIAVHRTPIGTYHYRIISDVHDVPVISFNPKVAHNVLLGPGAEILVWQAGQPVLNTEMREPQDRFSCQSFDFEYDRLEKIIREIL